MKILARVCVEFRDHTGMPVFRVNIADRHCILDAPDSIQEDPIFNLLLADHSLEVVSSKDREKVLELDPIQDTDATGKRKSSPKTTKKPTAGDAAGKDEKAAADAEKAAAAETAAGADK